MIAIFVRLDALGLGLMMGLASRYVKQVCVIWMEMTVHGILNIALPGVRIKMLETRFASMNAT